MFAVTIYVVYFLLRVFFSAEKKGRVIIITSLLLILAGFISVFIALNFYNNFFLRFIYLILSLLIGWLFYLTGAGALLRLISFFKIPNYRLLLARVGVIGATIFFIIGVVYGLWPKVKTVELELANLPQQWRNQKIVLISDLHLGSIHGVNILRKNIERINNLKPDYLIITGDLFDGHPGQLAKIGPELKNFSADKKVIFIAGNHDKYLGLDKLEPYLDEANILSLIDEAVVIDNLEIIGYDFLDREWHADRQIKNLSSYSSQTRLLLNHTPTKIQEAKDLNISLQLSGHSHRGQMWPVSFFTRLIYGKYHYGLNTEGQYNIYTTSGLGSWGPPLRTFNRPEIVQIILK